MMLLDSGRAIFFGTLVFAFAWAGSWFAALVASLIPEWGYLGSVILTTAVGAGAGWLVVRTRLPHRAQKPTDQQVR